MSKTQWLPNPKQGKQLEKLFKTNHSDNIKTGDYLELMKQLGVSNSTYYELKQMKRGLTPSQAIIISMIATKCNMIYKLELENIFPENVNSKWLNEFLTLLIDEVKQDSNEFTIALINQLFYQTLSRSNSYESMQQFEVDFSFRGFKTDDFTLAREDDLNKEMHSIWLSTYNLISSLPRGFDKESIAADNGHVGLWHKGLTDTKPHNLIDEIVRPHLYNEPNKEE